MAAAAAAAAAPAAVAAGRADATPTRRRRIAVVGTDLTGLAAAYVLALTDAYDVDVYEDGGQAAYVTAALGLPLRAAAADAAAGVGAPTGASSPAAAPTVRTEGGAARDRDPTPSGYDDATTPMRPDKEAQLDALLDTMAAMPAAPHTLRHPLDEGALVAPAPSGRAPPTRVAACARHALLHTRHADAVGFLRLLGLGHAVDTTALPVAICHGAAAAAVPAAWLCDDHPAAFPAPLTATRGAGRVPAAAPSAPSAVPLQFQYVSLGLATLVVARVVGGPRAAVGGWLAWLSAWWACLLLSVRWSVLRWQAVRARDLHYPDLKGVDVRTFLGQQGYAAPFAMALVRHIAAVTHLPVSRVLALPAAVLLEHLATDGPLPGFAVHIRASPQAVVDRCLARVRHVCYNTTVQRLTWQKTATSSSAALAVQLHVVTVGHGDSDNDGAPATEAVRTYDRVLLTQDSVTTRRLLKRTRERTALEEWPSVVDVLALGDDGHITAGPGVDLRDHVADLAKQLGRYHPTLGLHMTRFHAVAADNAAPAAAASLTLATAYTPTPETDAQQLEGLPPPRAASLDVDARADGRSPTQSGASSPAPLSRATTGSALSLLAACPDATPAMAAARGIAVGGGGGVTAAYESHDHVAVCLAAPDRTSWHNPCVAAGAAPRASSAVVPPPSDELAAWTLHVAPEWDALRTAATLTGDAVPSCVPAVPTASIAQAADKAQAAARAAALARGLPAVRLAGAYLAPGLDPTAGALEVARWAVAQTLRALPPVGDAPLKSDRRAADVAAAAPDADPRLPEAARLWLDAAALAERRAARYGGSSQARRAAVRDAADAGRAVWETDDADADGANAADDGGEKGKDEGAAAAAARAARRRVAMDAAPARLPVMAGLALAALAILANWVYLDLTGQYAANETLTGRRAL